MKTITKTIGNLTIVVDFQQNGSRASSVARVEILDKQDSKLLVGHDSQSNTITYKFNRDNGTSHEYAVVTQERDPAKIGEACEYVRHVRTMHKTPKSTSIDKYFDAKNRIVKLVCDDDPKHFKSYTAKFDDHNNCVEQIYSQDPKHPGSSVTHYVYKEYCLPGRVSEQRMIRQERIQAEDPKRSGSFVIKCSYSTDYNHLWRNGISKYVELIHCQDPTHPDSYVVKHDKYGNCIEKTCGENPSAPGSFVAEYTALDCCTSMIMSGDPKNPASYVAEYDERRRCVAKIFGQDPGSSDSFIIISDPDSNQEVRIDELSYLQTATQTISIGGVYTKGELP